MKNLLKKDTRCLIIQSEFSAFSFWNYTDVCKLLGAKYPGIDMISFGPTIEGAHSPHEKVNIKDVEKFYKILKSILKELT